MLRVACDTNVLVSAFIAAGPPSRVIEEAADHHIELLLAEPVLVELERVLTQKLRFTPERWIRTRALLLDVTAERLPRPIGPPQAVSGDPDDDLILACAVAGASDVLVSGDRKHLLPVGEHRGVRIRTPQALLAEIRRGA